jgi:type II secretory pathway pseudopilin PulG
MILQKRKKTQGISLLEIAIVLLIIGLAFGMIFGTTGALREGQQRATVRTQLETIDTALANFVVQYKRLPCPADATGREKLLVVLPPATSPPSGACDPADQVSGVVPWVTLGLSEADATDPWARRISYRVDPILTAPTAIAPMDMSNCDPSSSLGGLSANGACKTPVLPCTGGNGCTSPSEFLANKGLDVWDGLNGAAGWAVRQNNRSNGTGAAYVLISHGADGATNISPPLIPPPVVTLEQANFSDRPLALPVTQANTYRDAPLNDVVGVNHFDDYLSHPTIMTVLTKANLGPRAHP